MTKKVISNESVNIFEANQHKVKIENEFKNVKSPTFNVMQSSEISKVLRELTQCVASEQDLLVPSRQEIIWDVQCSQNNVIDTIPRNDISCSEVSGSTTTNCSMDLVQERRNDQSHVCDDCGKQFSKKDFLQKHRIVHEEPRHRCNVCEKSFVREDKLKRHFVSIHSKQRPHVCSICAKAFARKDKLKDHQKHHLTVNNNFLCFDCHIPFVQKSDLNRHTRSAHKPDDGGPVVSGVAGQPNNRISSTTSAVAMPTSFLPLLTVHSQTVLPLTVNGITSSTKARKPRSKRPTKSQKRSDRSSTSCTTVTTAESNAITSVIASTISNPAVLYPHLPLITHLHSPSLALGLYPGTVSASSTSFQHGAPPPSLSYASSSTSMAPYFASSIATAPPPRHGIESSTNSYQCPLDPSMISSVFSSTSSSSCTFPTTSLDASLQQHHHQQQQHHHDYLRHPMPGMLLPYHHLCHVPNHPYYSYLQQRPPPPIIGHSSAMGPLTANIYPYMPF